jgi:hypothetical protein
MVKHSEIRGDGPVLLDARGREIRPNGARIEGVVVASTRFY